MTNIETVDLPESKSKKREKQLLDGRKAMAEHEAARRAVYAKTDRLRALRLARDAAGGTVLAKLAQSSAAKKRSA